MKSETWLNKDNDKVIIVDEHYINHYHDDKCDSIRYVKDLDYIRLELYKNEFRPVSFDINVNSHSCMICENFGCCSKDGGCCGDDVLSKPCCTCKHGIICPGQKMLNDNFKLKTLDTYENNKCSVEDDVKGLELTEGEIDRIKKQTEEEYNNIEINTTKNNIVVKILVLGILILIALLVRTIADTKNTVSNAKMDTKIIEVEIDDSGKITSKQNLNIGDN